MMQISSTLTPVIPSPTAIAGSGVNATSGANFVPTERQTGLGVIGIPETKVLSRDYSNHRQPTILRHPRQAPSGISSENFLLARSLLSPAFQHSVLATKMARISNLHAEAPRFQDQIDILAWVDLTSFSRGQLFLFADSSIFEKGLLQWLHPLMHPCFD